MVKAHNPITKKNKCQRLTLYHPSQYLRQRQGEEYVRHLDLYRCSCLIGLDRSPLAMLFELLDVMRLRLFVLICPLLSVSCFTFQGCPYVYAGGNVGGRPCGYAGGSAGIEGKA